MVVTDLSTLPFFGSGVVIRGGCFLCGGWIGSSGFGGNDRLMEDKYHKIGALDDRNKKMGWVFWYVLYMRIDLFDLYSGMLFSYLFICGD